MSLPRISLYSIQGRQFGIGHSIRMGRFSKHLPSCLGTSVGSDWFEISIRPGDPKTGVSLRQPNTYLKRIAHHILRSRPSVAVLDLPWWEADFSNLEDLQSLAGLEVKLVGVDGPLKNNGIFDLVFLPSFAKHPKSAQSEAPVKFGWDCYILENRGKRFATNNEGVLVATGGSDYMGLGEIWPEMLDQHLSPGTRVTWIQGPHSPPPRIPMAPRVVFDVRKNPSNISELMGHSGHGLSVHGITLFEMLASGLPSVSFSPYGEKDVFELEELARLNLVETSVGPEDAVIRLAKLISDSTRSQTYSHHASERLSVLGEDTLCTEIQLLNGTGS